jgi:hypothetical protein
LRSVGTGGSLAGNEGVTVRWAVEDGVGLAVDVAAVAGFEVVVEGVVVVFAVVVVVAAAFGVVAHAARTEDDVKLR